MSWGYWGIVAGLLVLLTIFFFCMDLLYREEKKMMHSEDIPDGQKTTRAADSKHAA
jgi:hypothetical protein